MKAWLKFNAYLISVIFVGMLYLAYIAITEQDSYRELTREEKAFFSGNAAGYETGVYDTKIAYRLIR